ncbi:hypothetical protein Tco_0840581 [Tanacetum coccineum]|uniref:Uncharacterized protein n=1 Tax=Tanacetum coccineum TaxID=301880 RepID=A0ABQ5AYC9_9ASTR
MLYQLAALPQTIVDQDATSSSNSHTTQETQTPIIFYDAEEENHDIKVTHMGNDPYFGIPIPEVTSDPSSSSDVNVRHLWPPNHQVFCSTIAKWTKDHPLSIYSEVWEIVPPPDKAFVITLKWIYKVKLDELGDADHAGCQDTRRNTSGSIQVLVLLIPMLSKPARGKGVDVYLIVFLAFFEFDAMYFHNLGKKVESKTLKSAWTEKDHIDNPLERKKLMRLSKVCLWERFPKNSKKFPSTSDTEERLSRNDEVFKVKELSERCNNTALHINKIKKSYEQVGPESRKIQDAKFQEGRRDNAWSMILQEAQDHNVKYKYQGTCSIQKSMIHYNNILKRKSRVRA